MTDMAYYRACILALSDKDIEDNIQYSIEPTRNKFQAPREVSVVRDYDSFLSFTDWLPVKSDLFIYLLNNPVETLHSNIHIKVPMSIHSGQVDRPMSSHTVPNICLGAVGIHTKVRLFFPWLYNPQRKDVELSFEEKKGLYEKSLMPVLIGLSPDTVTNWHVSYQSALTHAKKTRGIYQYSTHPLSGNCVRRTAFPWAKGMLFMVQEQGVKDANQHHPEDIDEAEDVLMKTLSDFYYDDLMGEEHCYVDVGLEMSKPGYAYQWRTDAHYMTHAQAGIILKLRLMHLFSCHTPVPVCNNQDPVYFQAYTTDKALIQQKDEGKYSLALTGKAALAERIPPYLQGLYELYFDAKNHHGCAARVEVRLRLQDAITQANNFLMWLILEPLCLFTRLDRWQWRCVRVQGIIRTLSLQNSGSSELCFTATALTLTAGLQWLANGLHSRPDDGFATQDIMCCILPLTHDYDVDSLHIVPHQHHIDNDNALPFCPYEAYFFREMVFPPIADVPRTTCSHVLSHTSYKYFFGCEFSALRNRYHPTAYIPRNMVPKSHVNTQKGMFKHHRADIPEPSAVFADLNFEAPPPAQDIGVDLPFDEQFDLPRLNMDEHLHVTDDVYKDANLAVIFNHVQWKRAHPVEWREAFDLFFLPPSTPPRLQPQNYPSMMEWADMKHDKPANIIDTIRKKYYHTRTDSGSTPQMITSSLSHPHSDPLHHTSLSTLANWHQHGILNVCLEETEEEEVEVIDPNYIPAAEWVSNILPIPMHIYMRQEEEKSESD
ncbi:hypothetical protein P692DRAFT_20849548 [Suillus brevipes Sb2]|nr:hypothetical protein P692DRAFT_20849548 [Suillus brevipes Sb2]